MVHDKHNLFTEAFVLQVTYIQSLKFQVHIHSYIYLKFLGGCYIEP